MKILTGKEVFEAAKGICSSGSECYIAVSYWSGDASRSLGLVKSSNARIVLDVYGGGTSSTELKRLMEHFGDKVRVHRDLHTKIYASKHNALVGSANATRPGLQLQATERVEAVVELENQDALSAFEFAKEIYQAGIPATAKHIEICEQRFGRRPLSQTEVGKVERLDLFSALLKQPDLYSHLPVIATNEGVDKRERNVAWSEQRAELDPAGKSEHYSHKLWDNYNWRLSEEYAGKVCLALHNGGQSSVWVGLVRPFPNDGEDWTFAQRVPWDEVPGLKYSGVGARRIEKSVGRDKLRKAIEWLVEDDRATIWGRDLIQVLNMPTTLLNG